MTFIPNITKLRPMPQTDAFAYKVFQTFNNPPPLKKLVILLQKRLKPIEIR